MRIFLFLLLLTGLAGCDPYGAQNPYDMGVVPLTAHVIRPRPVIHLGDSVGFYFEVPDTITVNGKRLRWTATSKTDGVDVGYFANRINPSYPGGYNVLTPYIPTYTKLGTLVQYSGSLSLTNQGSKLRGEFYLIPNRKGIYFFKQSQLGYLELNDGSLLLRTSLSFGNVDRSHQLLIDSAGTASLYNVYLHGLVDAGLEVYGFRVI